MGERFVKFFKTRIKAEYKLGFFAAFIVTLLFHIYKFTNTLPNHDSVFNYYSTQNVLGSGRWALSLACGISSYYDLPWVIGILSAVFIGLTVVVIIALFKIKNPVIIVLTGALIAASPATTETFFFLYTADGYMVAMFLSALAVYLSRIEENRIHCMILSALCVCVSCAIYQAYVSFALLVAVCYFIYVLLKNSFSKQSCFKWVLRQAVIYVAALASYYGIWQLIMHISNVAANDYQGISSVGSINLDLLLNGLINSVKGFIFYFLQWNILKHGFTLNNVLGILFIVAFAAGLIIAVVKSGILHRKWSVLLLVFCLIAIIPFAYMWYFTSPTVGYRPIMLQSITLLFVLTLLLYEQWGKLLVKETVCLLMTVIVFNNALMANISYYYLDMCYEQTYADAVEMMIEIHDLQDEQEFDSIAVVGTKILDVQHETVDTTTGEPNYKGNMHRFLGLLEKTLIFDSDHTVHFLKANFGLDLDVVDYDARNKMLDDPQVQAMGCWPEGDSITVIDNTLVIKLSDTKE